MRHGFSIILGALLLMFAAQQDPSSAQPRSNPAAAGEAALAVSASNAFGLDLFGKLAAGESDRSIFISPYSILSALSMTAAGAQGHTAEEMQRVLHLPERPGAIHPALSSLNHRFTTRGETPEVRETKQEIERLRGEQRTIGERVRAARDWKDSEAASQEEKKIVARINELLATIDPTELSVANALWGEKTYPFKKSYVETVSEYYGTGALRQADFRNKSDEERARINDWAEETTRGRIRDLLPPRSLDALTRLVLANAIYFKGEWEKPFEKAQTRPEDFTQSNGEKLQVPLMMQSAEVRYGAFLADGSFFETPAEIAIGDEKTPRYPDRNGFAILELPYRGGKLCMLVIAPNRADGLGAIQEKLDSKALATWTGQLRKREVQVYLPKFKEETEYDLDATLIAMGMGSAFEPPGSPGGANFGGMTDSERPEGQLYIGLVRHKAFVEVNEEGTEAAAATAIVMLVETDVVRTVPFIPVFRADRPFLYLIRDVETGCILFLGRMTGPA